MSQLLPIPPRSRLPGPQRRPPAGLARWRFHHLRDIVKRRRCRRVTTTARRTRGGRRTRGRSTTTRRALATSLPLTLAGLGGAPVRRPPCSALPLSLPWPLPPSTASTFLPASCPPLFPRHISNDCTALALLADQLTPPHFTHSESESSTSPSSVKKVGGRRWALHRSAVEGRREGRGHRRASTSGYL